MMLLKILFVFYLIGCVAAVFMLRTVDKQYAQEHPEEEPLHVERGLYAIGLVLSWFTVSVLSLGMLCHYNRLDWDE